MDLLTAERTRVSKEFHPRGPTTEKALPLRRRLVQAIQKCIWLVIRNLWAGVEWLISINIFNILLFLGLIVRWNFHKFVLRNVTSTHRTMCVSLHGTVNHTAHKIIYRKTSDRSRVLHNALVPDTVRGSRQYVLIEAGACIRSFTVHITTCPPPHT